MTVITEEKICCVLCGAGGTYPVIGSIDKFEGSADLDLRPPEPARSTIYTWVQRCPGCGYCESDVSRSIPGAQEAMQSAEYIKQLADPAFPDLADSFLCKAVIDRGAGDYAAATWALIYAAWVCDDSGNRLQAEACRKKAADMLLAAEGHKQNLAEQEETNTVILVDLLRRSGQAERARELIERRGGDITGEITARILDFQRYLIYRNDTSYHRISEALKEKKRSRVGQCSKCGRVF